MKTAFFLLGLNACFIAHQVQAGTNDDLHLHYHEHAAADGAAVDITFKDCGADDATVTGLTPNSLNLGQSQAFIGSGTNKKHITGGTFKMSMTGVGGVSLLGKCTGDLASPASCNIGLGPITIGKLSYGGLKFPQEPGALSMPGVTTISLPASLPKFALTTTTRLETVDQDGATTICLEIYSKTA